MSFKSDILDVNLEAACRRDNLLFASLTIFCVLDDHLRSEERMTPSKRVSSNVSTVSLFTESSVENC